MTADTGTDWAAVANYMDRRADYLTDHGRTWPYPAESPEHLRAAAVGLRRLAQLDTAHQELFAAISRAEEWAMSDEGFRERVNLAVAMYGAPAAVLGVGEQPEGPPICPTCGSRSPMYAVRTPDNPWGDCADSWHGEQR